MNIFETVKNEVIARQAAEQYGIAVNRQGMAKCPFHDDKHPSMKLDKRFHCFGCGEDGDVIDFVGKLFGLSPKDAANKIMGDFGIGAPNRIKKKSILQKVKRKKTPEQELKELENYCYRVLSDYLHLLMKWKTEYRPMDENEIWHPKFVEALSCITHVEYLLDVLLEKNLQDIAFLILDYGKEVEKIERRITEARCSNKECTMQSDEKYQPGYVARTNHRKFKDNQQR